MNYYFKFLTPQKLLLGTSWNPKTAYPTVFKASCNHAMNEDTHLAVFSDPNCENLLSICDPRNFFNTFNHKLVKDFDFQGYFTQANGYFTDKVIYRLFWLVDEVKAQHGEAHFQKVSDQLDADTLAYMRIKLQKRRAA